MNPSICIKPTGFNPVSYPLVTLSYWSLPSREVLTGGSLMTDGRVTQIFQKEKMEVIIPMVGIIYFSGGFSRS
jgi:hypothetical protein